MVQELQQSAMANVLAYHFAVAALEAGSRNFRGMPQCLEAVDDLGSAELTKLSPEKGSGCLGFGVERRRHVLHEPMSWTALRTPSPEQLPG